MAHVRTQIRDAIEVALASLATPQAVYIERKHRLSHDLLPAVVVSLMDDEAQSDQTTMGDPYEVETDQSFLVELHASAPTGREAAETIDQMDLEVEAALSLDLSLGGLLQNITPAGSQYADSVDQDRVTAVRAVAYLATWRHMFGAADSPE